MKQQIPINALSGNVAPTITSHYHKAGWSDLRPRGTIGGHKPEIAILEIEMEEPKPIQVAQIYDREQNPINGRVYSDAGIAPTLRTPSGGLSEPKIIQVGNYKGDGTSNPQTGRVYSVEGIAPTLIGNCQGGDREPKIMQIGSYSPSSACNAKVLDPDGLCPTLLDRKGAEPAIIESPPIKIRQATAQGYIECPPGGGFDAAYPNSKLRRGRVQDNGDVVGAITASGDEHCVYEGAEVIGSMQSNAMRGSLDGVSPCLTEAMGTGGGQIPMIVQMPHGYNPGYLRNGEVSPAITTSSWESNNMLVEPCGCYDNQFGEFAREPLEGLSRTVKTDGHNAVLLKYRIRKLTPTECFRLMGMDDADIEKIDAYRIKTVLKSGKVKEKPIPKSAKYKLAGNSIVVDVLYHLFRNMFLPSCNTNPKRHEPSLADFW